MAQIITGTIRKYVYQDVESARFFDFAYKQGVSPCGAGIKDEKVYMLFVAEDMYYINELWKQKISEQENLKNIN